MSYINSDSGPGFSKAVISFWFRVPQASLDKAGAASGKEGAMLDGIVPLVVMGKEGTGQTPYKQTKDEHVLVGTSSGTECGGALINLFAECTGEEEIFPGVFCCRESIIVAEYECNCTSGTSEAYGTTYHTTKEGPAPPTDPSFIGVDSQGYLYVNFESTRKPSVSGYGYELSSITPGSSSGSVVGQCKSGSTGFGCDVLCCVCLIIECSNSEVDNGNGYDNTTSSPPESPGTGTDPAYHYTDISFTEDRTGSIYSNDISVSADEWHHVLISCDLSGVKTHGGEWDGNLAQFVDSAAKLWIALDDKNYTKGDLSGNWSEKGDNDVITDGAYAVAGTQPNKEAGGGIAQYSLDSTAVPAGAIGMPAIGKYVNNIYNVEMAEFQMWTGLTLNTASTAARRAFLDYKRDAKGNIVPEKDKTFKLRPVNPKKAEKLMGRKPNIMLHGSSRWKKGDNTGSARGDFKPTGEIVRYMPDPSVLGVK